MPSKTPPFIADLEFSGSPWLDFETNRVSQYGLYEPITNRFIFVGHQYSSMKILTKLFSSRYILSLVDLTSAMNWDDSLIDNSCCTSWGSIELSKDRFSQQLFFNSLPIRITELNEYGSPNESELYLKDQPYMHFTYNLITWIRDYYLYMYLRRQDSDYDVTFEDIDLFYYEHLDFFKDFTGKDFSSPEYIFRLSQKIYNIIYLETNFEIAKEQLTPLIKQIAHE